MLVVFLTMEPKNPPGSSGIPAQQHDGLPPVGSTGTVGEPDLDSLFSEYMGDGAAPAETLAAKLRETIEPKVRGAIRYLEHHRLVTMFVGFGMGFTLGRMLRRRS